MNTDKIKVLRQVSVTVEVSNVNDAGRKADVTAKATVENDRPVRTEGGQALRDGRMLASFTLHSENNLNINYLCQADERRDVYAAIEDFMASL